MIFRTTQQKVPVLSFRVRIAPDCVQQVRSYRQAFLSAIDTNRYIHCSFVTDLRSFAVNIVKFD